MSQPNDDKISNNPSFSKMEKELAGMKMVANLTSVLERLGIRNEKISGAMEQIPGMAQQFEDIKTIPDVFNYHFSDRGWVAYEGMNFGLMKQAVALAIDGDIDAAEELLAEHYDSEIIRQNLLRMQFIPEFKPRKRLLFLAMDDFVAERYHACVPVVLANIDGLVNDIEAKGFFAEGTDLTAWDSIAAHSSGLQKLAQLFRKGRKKTTTETITIPYRNGIMHGRDLGYDNKLIATKAWAALFALRDWVSAIRKPTSEPKQKSSMRDVLQKLKETQEEKERIKNWKPREIKLGTDLPVTGYPNEYELSTPERTLAEFMLLWTKKNYGHMGQLLCSHLQQETPRKTAGWVRKEFGKVKLISFSILHVDDFACSVTVLNVKVIFCTEDEVERNETREVRLIHENDSGKIVTRGNPKGIWTLLVPPFISQL